MDTKAIDIYKKAVAANFSFLKSGSNIQEAFLRAIPIEKSGFLIPVCKAHEDDRELLQKLTDWRNNNVHVYPTQFVATIDSTKAWLKDRLLDVEDRILFLVVDNQGKVAGHIGFNACSNNEFLFEIDNVVRADQAAAKGLFSIGLIALMEWARKTLNVGGFFLRVMDDNQHAIDFYKRNEFVENRRIPLFKEERKGLISYREAGAGEQAEKSFVLMLWQPVRASIGKSLILTAGPSISAKEAVYSFDAAVYGWNSNWSKYLTAFEKQFAEYIGVKYALATSSCTGALQIALMALDIGPGDEVIVPDLTWVATANAVRYVGAIPVFADIELDSWNIDASSAEALITSKTKAIVAVHLYGYPARMNKVLDIAKKYGLKVVEDAAPAVGAEWQGKRCGSFGDFAAFSFQGAKLMVTGEGGMLVTDDDSLYQRALKIWDQGRDPSRAFWIDADGVKFKMSNLQGAFGLAQLERVDEMIEMKRRLFSWYRDGLQGVPHITFNNEVEGARSINWMTSILLDKDAPIGRDELMSQLKKRNVDSRCVFPSISQYPIWPRKSVPRPNALYVGENGINLPSGVCLSKEEAAYICTQIRDILTK
jgi:perosamine synthetase